MPARRCSIGCHSWPDEPLFRHCSVCGGITQRIGNIEPDLERDLAKSLLLEYLFEKYYALWCAKRGQPVEGPLPEEPQRILETAE